MHTPAHAVLNLCLLDRVPGARAWTLAGALVPDLPMFGFYAWASGVEGMSQMQIWGEAYFRPEWQLFFDLFNSIPLALVGLGAALLARHSGWRLFFGSVLLHCVADLGLHHDDGHRHFLPLSSFRFESPVSYWDPRYHGDWGAGGEALLVMGSSIYLWPRVPVAGRAALALVCALYLAAQLWLRLA